MSHCRYVEVKKVCACDLLYGDVASLYVGGAYLWREVVAVEGAPTNMTRVIVTYNEPRSSLTDASQIGSERTTLECLDLVSVQVPEVAP